MKYVAICMWSKTTITEKLFDTFDTSKGHSRDIVSEYRFNLYQNRPMSAGVPSNVLTVFNDRIDEYVVGQTYEMEL